MSNNIDLVASMNYATMQINRHVAAIMLLFGTVGNILNICVLTEQSLKKIPWAVYLCWSSVSSIVFLWSALLTRVLQGYNVNWPNQNQPLCKIRLFLLNVTWAVGTWALVGASIDRFLCSHRAASYRQLSANRIAKRYLIGIFFLFLLIFAEIIYCFEASVPNVPVACYGRNLPCRIYNDWMALLFDIVLPGIFLIIFGMLTIRHARSRIAHPVVHSIVPIITNNRTSVRNNDRNLTRMLMIQVVVVLVLDLPFGIYRLYASITADVSKTTLRVATENLIYALVILLVFFTHSTSFYLYTLTGSLYRAAFKRIGQRYFNRIHPIH